MQKVTKIVETLIGEIDGKIEDLAGTFAESRPGGPSETHVQDVLAEIEIISFFVDSLIMLIRKLIPHPDESDHGFTSRLGRVCEVVSQSIGSVVSCRGAILGRQKFDIKYGAHTILHDHHANIDKRVSISNIIGVYMVIKKFVANDRAIMVALFGRKIASQASDAIN